MTTQHRKLESLISGYETRNCNVSLITAAAAVALSSNLIASGKKLTGKQGSSFHEHQTLGEGWEWLGTRRCSRIEAAGQFAKTMASPAPPPSTRRASG